MIEQGLKLEEALLFAPIHAFDAWGFDKKSVFLGTFLGRDGSWTLPALTLTDLAAGRERLLENEEEKGAHALGIDR